MKRGNMRGMWMELLQEQMSLHCLNRFCLKGVSHQNYVELRTDYTKLILSYAVPTLAYAAIRRGTQKGTRDGRPENKHV